LIGHCDPRDGSSFHRLFDRLNIRCRCAVEPRGVHAQRDLDAVSVLLRDPEQILSEHELPRHLGMARVVGRAPANAERGDVLAPAPVGDFRVADRRSVVEEEKMLMTDFAGLDAFVPECQVPPKNFERARAKLYVAVLCGALRDNLKRVLVANLKSWERGSR
jgi:hypothetical protein